MVVRSDFHIFRVLSLHDSTPNLAGKLKLCMYRVFPLNSTPFKLKVEQHKLDSCDIGCLPKTLQDLCFYFYELLTSFQKITVQELKMVEISSSRQNVATKT